MILDINGKESAVFSASSRYPGLSVGVNYKGKTVYSAFNPYVENSDLETSQRDVSTQRSERTTVAQAREDMEFLQETGEKDVFNVFRASAPRTMIRKVRYNPETQELSVIERQPTARVTSQVPPAKPSPPPSAAIEEPGPSTEATGTQKKTKRGPAVRTEPTPEARPTQPETEAYSLDLENMSAKRQRIYHRLDERFKAKIDEFVQTFNGRPNEMPRSWNMKSTMRNFRQVYQIKLNDGERVTLTWNPDTKKILLFQMLGHT